jgi:uncharacterized protein (DUF433 family)
MKTVESYIEINGAGLAKIKESEVLVGDVLMLVFLYRWSVDDLVNFFPGLTSEMINAAFGYASDNPDTVEGQFFFSVDPCPLMRVLGII